MKVHKTDRLKKPHSDKMLKCVTIQIKTLENQKDLSMFILTWLYGFSQNACYKIEPQDQIIIKEHYQFREFMIRRVEDE